MIKKFSSPKMRNRQFFFEPKPPYDLAAAEGGGGSVDLQFPKWCARQDSNLRPFGSKPNTLIH